MRRDQSHDKSRLNGSAEARRVFVDLLCLSSLPWVLLLWVAGWMRVGVKPLRIYYFGITPRAEHTLRWLALLLPVGVEEADYSIVELVDANGGSAWLQVWTGDLREVCDAITRVHLKDHPLVQRMGRRFGLPRVLIYLEKRNYDELIPVMIKIRVVEWFRRQWQLDGDVEIALFVARSPWHRQVAAYAAGYSVRLAGYGPPAGWRPRAASRWLWRFLRFVWAGAARMARSAAAQAGNTTHPVAVETTGPARIAVQYSGMGLTLDPSKRSDLFWLPAAKAEPGQVLVYFERGDDPLDETRKSSLEEAGISCVAMNPQAVVCEGVDVWCPESHTNAKAPHRRLSQWLLSLVLSVAWRSPRHLNWLVPKLSDLISEYSGWYAFFSDYNVKVHVSFIDWPAARVAADIALSDLGGVSVSYERTSEHFLSVFRSSAVDVHFAFGHNGTQAERQSGSLIAQYVTAGYSHDNSFAVVRARAESLRARLRSNGARFIICYLDENSSDDSRVAMTHEEAAVNYAYLLKRLLDDASLGLIFKPKKPATLRTRLGPVARLLDQALATGRCHIFDQGIVATDVLPNEAGQAADVTVGLLDGSTAGLESTLAGTPTLLLDRVHLVQHPYYQWGRDRVIFCGWEALFAAMTAYRRDPASVPGFGDWSPVLDRLDPFRDGRAAERIGTYIRWLAEGLSTGLPADETLEQTRRRYVTSWGADKVIGLRDGPTASAPGDAAPKGGPEYISADALTMTTRKGSEEVDA